MQLIGGLIGGPLLKMLFGGNKKPKPVSAPQVATRDDAAATVARDDELRRRRGSAADIVTGGSGEAGPGGKFVLGN